MSSAHEDVVVQDELAQFKLAFAEDYSKRENIFRYTKIVVTYLCSIVLEGQQSISGDFSDLLNFFLPEDEDEDGDEDATHINNKWIKLKKFHDEKLPLVYSYPDKTNKQNLINFHDLMFGSMFRRGSKFYGTNFLRYSKFTDFVPPHEDITNDYENFFEEGEKDNYYLSRRFDGWAAVWNGKNLYSRNGKDVFITIPKDMDDKLRSSFKNDIVIGVISVINSEGEDQTTNYSKRNIPAAFGDTSTKGTEVCKRLCFFIYDIISLEHRSLPFSLRYQKLKDKIGDNQSNLSVQFVVQDSVEDYTKEAIDKILFQEFISNRKGLVLTHSDATYLQLWGEKKRKKVGVKPKLVANTIANVSGELPYYQGSFTEIDFEAVIDEEWKITYPNGDSKTVAINKNFHVRRESRRISDFDNWMEKPLVISPGDFKNDFEFGMDTRYLGAYIDPYFLISFVEDSGEKKEGEISCNLEEDFSDFFVPQIIGKQLIIHAEEVLNLGETPFVPLQEMKKSSKVNFYLKASGYNFNFNEFELLSDFNFSTVDLVFLNKGTSTPLKKQCTIMTEFNSNPEFSVEDEIFWISQFYKDSDKNDFKSNQNEFGSGNGNSDESSYGDGYDFGQDHENPPPNSDSAAAAAAAAAAEAAAQAAAQAAAAAEAAAKAEAEEYDNALKINERTDLKVLKSDYKFISHFSRKAHGSKTLTRGDDNLTFVYLKQLEEITNGGVQEVPDGDGNTDYAVNNGPWYTIFFYSNGKITKVFTESFDEIVFKSDDKIDFNLNNVKSTNPFIDRQLKEAKEEFKIFVNSRLKRYSDERENRIKALKRKYTNLIDNFAKSNLSVEPYNLPKKFIGNESEFWKDNIAQYLSFFLNIGGDFESSRPKAELYFNFYLIFLIFEEKRIFNTFLRENFVFRPRPSSRNTDLREKDEKSWVNFQDSPS